MRRPAIIAEAIRINWVTISLVATAATAAPCGSRYPCATAQDATVTARWVSKSVSWALASDGFPSPSPLAPALATPRDKHRLPAVGPPLPAV